MSKPLVIVESPAKAKTISSFLGNDYIVRSSIGHIRDLPRSADEVPGAYKKESWARLGVDVNNSFKPLYVIPKERKEIVKELKELAKDSSEIYLATDEDREGESIAWHLTEVLSPSVPVKRMVFHEITKDAILRAIENWRELDRRLVDAQETRRILDRLYGFEVSPVLWKKVIPKLSAGRVQSVALRMIVEREKERIAFKKTTWWSLDAIFEKDLKRFKATLIRLNDKKVAVSKDFGPDGEVRANKEELVVLDEQITKDISEILKKNNNFRVLSVEEKPFSRSPSPPFITSTLQQEASRKLRFSAATTMRIAQRLYEAGWITYMRTDSVALSEQATNFARKLATSLYGSELVPTKPRTYKSKTKNAQEAHEAIRPAGETFRSLEEASKELDRDAYRLYELIWKRSIASQMKDAKGKSTRVVIGSESNEGIGKIGADGLKAEFVTSGSVIEFPGFLSVYEEGRDEETDEDAELVLPNLFVDDTLRALEINPNSHETMPPARFTEATLIKALEEKAIGRPSTYASIIETILRRDYVFKKGNALVPTYVAFVVVKLLETYFNDLVDYNFTASLEDALDAIARGEKESLPYLTEFYFGSKNRLGLKNDIEKNLAEIDAREINSICLGKGKDGNEITIRVGRYGPFLEKGEERQSIPEDILPDELSVEEAEALFSRPANEKVLGTDPATGLPVYAKVGRFGPYVQLGDANLQSKEKPKMAALFSGMDINSLSLEDALKLLSLPRLVGKDDKTDEEIYAQNGRYGPYLVKGKETRSLKNEQEIFDISLEEALKLFSQPKVSRRTPQASILKELIPKAGQGLKLQVKSGRYGPYVTDGEVNASLPKGISIDELDYEQAISLIEKRRENAPTRKVRGKKKSGASVS